MQVSENNIRLEREKGGGPLYDIGIYCINAARYLFRAEPVEVTGFAARDADRRFDPGVEPGMSCLLRFDDDQLGTFNCSFAASATATYRLVGTKGDLCLDQAFSHIGEAELLDAHQYPITRSTPSSTRSRSGRYSSSIRDGGYGVSKPATRSMGASKW